MPCTQRPSARLQHFLQAVPSADVMGGRQSHESMGAPILRCSSTTLLFLQVVDVIVSSDFSGNERFVKDIEESPEETSLRGPPPYEPSQPSAVLGGRSWRCCRLRWRAPRVFLSWMRVPWTVSEQQLIERAGLDGCDEVPTTHAFACQYAGRIPSQSPFAAHSALRP
jgi:hypothetical protein